MSSTEYYHGYELSRTYANFDADASKTSRGTGGFLICDNLHYLTQTGGLLNGNLMQVCQLDGTLHLVSKISLENFLIRNNDLSGLQEVGLSAEEIQAALDRFERNAMNISTSVKTLRHFAGDYDRFMQVLQEAGINTTLFGKGTIDLSTLELLIFKNKEIRLNIIPIFNRAFPAEPEPSTIQKPAIDLLHILHAAERDALLKEACTSRPKEFAQAVQVSFKNGLNLEQKIHLRKFLTREFPAHKEYMEYLVGDKDKKDYHERYIMPAGIEAIVEHLHNKERDPITLPLTIAPRFKTFEDFCDKLAKGEEVAFPQMFIIRCYKHHLKMPNNDSQLSKHMSAVYVYRTKTGVIRIVSTDSVKDEWLSLRRSLHQVVHNIQQKKKEVELFCFDIMRQYDEHNCAVFALNDSVEFCSNQGILDDFLSKVEAKEASVDIPGRGEKKVTIKIANITTLPLGFILPMQSVSAMNKYIDKYQAEEKELAKYEKSKKAHVDVDVLDKTSGGLVRKKQNILAERRGDKFEGLLWNKIILM
ncbi:MAG: hypothetical protein JSR46_10780 [Verrucomicrobia bacterium]|nr:hypothetical protein [Verrucomicrobiota bacterium]